MTESQAEDQLAIVRRLKETNAILRADLGALQSGGGGGTSGDMISVKDYVDARDEAVEARLMARLDTLATKADVASTRHNIWAAVGVALGIVLAVLAFASDRFDAGFGMADQRQAQLQRDAAQDRASAELRETTKAILTELERSRPPSR